MGAVAPRTITFAIGGPIARMDLPGLFARVCALLERSAGAEVIICDVTGIVADAVAADALARLQLGAHRWGCQVMVRGASAGLRELIAFMGLSEVLPAEATSPAAAAARTAGRSSPSPGRT